MAGPEEIAKAKITVEADVSGVKNAVSDAKTEIGSMADDVESSSKRAGGALESMGTKIDNSTAGMRKLTGAISGAIGAVTSLISVFGILISVLTTLIALFKKKAERLKDLRENYEGLRAQIEDFSLGSAIDEYERFENQINRSIDALLKEGEITKASAEGLRSLAAEAANVRRERDRDDESARKRLQRHQEELLAVRALGDAVRELDLLIESQEISLLPPDDQLIADAERQKRLIQDAFSRFALPDGLLEEAIANVDRITEKQLEAERERQRIADEAQAKRENEADRRSQERVQREIEALRQGLESITAGEFTTVLQSIPKILQEVSSRLGRLK